jgi:methionyl-tRNA synthetase
LCFPFLPNTAADIADMLNIGIPDWDHAGKTNLLKGGDSIKEAHLLFARVEDEVVENQLKKLREKAAALSPAPATSETTIQSAKEAITYEAFSAMDLRIAQVLEAEKVTGLDKRTIVSGIAQYYAPEQLPGKKVLVLVNLEPRKIRGIESKGMILMAEDASGKLSLVCPVEDVNPGSVVK